MKKSINEFLTHIALLAVIIFLYYIIFTFNQQMAQGVVQNFEYIKLFNVLYLIVGMVIALFVITVLKFKRTQGIIYCIMDMLFLVYFLFIYYFTSYLTPYPNVINFINTYQNHIYYLIGIISMIMICKIQKKS